jgi:hypothetical protein
MCALERTGAQSNNGRVLPSLSHVVWWRQTVCSRLDLQGKGGIPLLFFFQGPSFGKIIADPLRAKITKKVTKRARRFLRFEFFSYKNMKYRNERKREKFFIFHCTEIRNTL